MKIDIFSLVSSVEIFYMYYSVFSLVIALISLYFLKSKFITSKVKIVLFISMFNIILPIIGSFLTAWIVYYLLHIKYEETLDHVEYINMIDFENMFPLVNRILPEGGIKNLMLDERSDTSLRMKALVSLANNASRNELKLIKKCLSDKNDEIRLYSFAIIDKEERLINTKIHTQLEKLNEVVSSDEKLKAAEELVCLYWDMIYLELSDKALTYFIAEEIKRYGKIVLDIEPENIKVHVALGKMYLYNKNFSKAEKHFKIATEKGVNTDFNIPYLAEIYYNKRDFKAVKSLLERGQKLNLNFMLHPVVEQWIAK